MGEEFQETRFVYTNEQPVEGVGNAQVAGGLCAACRYRQARAGRCGKYRVKPVDVLEGRVRCEFFEGETEKDAAMESAGGKVSADFPPCVGCVHNDGALACRALGMKPERVVIGHEPCSAREEE